MHIIKFQEEAMEYMHDRDLLAKLCLHSLKEDALKWYFLLPEKSIDRYENLVHQFLHYFKYNIVEKVHFNYFYKIKKMPNQSVHDFVKIWKFTTNKITMLE